ncbi:Rpn family recombination-promoting nuclease/putative transposase [Salmonella enterica]|uniref:Rpn family recombination-promoting nuclease/putative transposase n=1 Tax=Salmonella diarizonae TaxID=59204 RepID=A0A6Y2KJR8_SALDZ|nr:Rpn family recombination-promoting nuclease/putative transposase [Salmonella enterica]QWJ71749.1 Rpn family recombination-promoting nuclease/putative transposase [Salmonella enterica subsp. diarizonae]EAX3655641.1 Rpn family recombination-promoting nuclease/putative transposase [Salmonella enterica]EAY8338611.1 Rpn family recombination-promoting nuclease/putative transposase [Salmonella enterica]EBQ1067465.1 Rpn family recombination-promoting nuclease/putative transposase [Salmonella enteric
MELISNTPHDAFFKQFLMHPDTARDFLDIHLPAEIRGICDLDTLRLESSHSVEESLKEQYSDVLYSVKMQGTSGYIHVLIEHQSTADKKMAFRMMRYAIAAMHRLLKDENGPLPLVVPLLFYQEKTSPYPLSMSWLDMFALPELARRIYSEPFPLVDITVIPDDDIMQHRRIALLERLVTLISAEYTTESQLNSLLSYMVQRGHTDQPQVFYRELANRLPQEESMMTLAEWFAEQGMQKGVREGMLEGKREGLQEGKTEERRNIARRMLESGMTREAVAQITTLTDDEIEQIIRWR